MVLMVYGNSFLISPLSYSLYALYFHFLYAGGMNVGQQLKDHNERFIFISNFEFLFSFLEVIMT
jgi:hypothetical protein